MAEGRRPGPPRLACIDKPAGLTSFDVVARVRKITGYRRVGHGGTLDPFATGVLVLGLGPATRLMRFLSSGHKVYEATVVFGAETDSDDCTGSVTRQVTAIPPAEAIRAALPGFTGRIEQVPPRFSAVHIDGERSYRRARRGEEVEPASREVDVHAFELVECDGARARLRVACGGGTYVRSLARDLGRALGSAAHLAGLRRTRVGPFSIGQARSLDEFEEGWDRGERGLDPTALVGDWPGLELDDEAVLEVRNGTQPRAEWWEGRGWDRLPDRVALLDGEGRLVGVAAPEGETSLRLTLVLPESG